MTAVFYVGDAVTVMNALPERSVDLILSSPPFLSLRSYLPLLDVVEACARVLARHGSLCFELGDTYSGGGQGPDARYEAKANQVLYSPTKRGLHSNGHWPLDKSLSLIPETFRFAMVYGHNPHTGRRTEPWRLRNVIRWVRPNPPVGALGDKFRPATSELMVFCKAKDRFFDLDAVRERLPHHDLKPYRTDPESAYKPDLVYSGDDRRTGGVHPAGAPPLDWWNIPPGGYPGAHYAVWPPELLVKPIKAMCPEKVCRRCGEASRRIVGEVEYTYGSGVHAGTVKPDTSLTGWESRTDGANRRNVQGVDNGNMVANRPTLGFSDCGHDDYRPGLVLDPFAGSGTTLAVATGHGRDAIGIDLDERNYDLALGRVGPLVLTRAA